MCISDGMCETWSMFHISKLQLDGILKDIHRFRQFQLLILTAYFGSVNSKPGFLKCTSKIGFGQISQNLTGSN